MLGFHFRWPQRRMPFADRLDDLSKHLVHHITDSGFHGTKLLTMRSQSAVRPTATDMKDAITIPA